MIFVAVGTQKFQFNRLLSAIDKLIADGIINEEVFAQTGHSNYIPKKYNYEKFISKERFDFCVGKCDLVITHSGVATIMSGLKLGKPVIVIPRLAKYAEHVDDHQIQIANVFSEANYVLMCNENDRLEVLIQEAKQHKFSKYVSQREAVIQTIRDYIAMI